MSGISSVVLIKRNIHLIWMVEQNFTCQNLTHQFFFVFFFGGGEGSNFGKMFLLHTAKLNVCSTIKNRGLIGFIQFYNFFASPQFCFFNNFYE